MGVSASLAAEVTAAKLSRQFNDTLQTTFKMFIEADC